MAVTFLSHDVTIQAGNALNLLDPNDLALNPLLNTAVAKLRWAERHLAALDSNITAATVDPEQNASLDAHFDPKTGYHVFHLAAVPDLSGLSENLPHAIADVVGPLRSALDKIAWKSARQFANGIPKDVPGVKFPICDSTTKWAEAGRARNQLVPAHCGLIESFQPYHGVQGWADNWTGSYIHPLALLQDLTNDDKHRDTQPVFLVAAKFHFRFRSDVLVKGPNDLPEWEFHGVGKPMDLGAEVLRVRFLPSADPEIKDAGRVAPVIALPERRDVIGSLQRIHRYVHLVLSEFARKFP